VSDNPEPGYYAARRARLQRGFDRFLKRASRSLARHYDAEFAEGVVANARVEFDRIIPEIPYIGGLRNVFSGVMIANGWIVALFRAMKSRGKSAEESVRICVEVSDQLMRSLPGFALRLCGRLAFARPFRRLLERQAARSRERRYPEDFVYSVREGDDGELALVFEECAVNKFYAAQGTEELAPYCNFFDVSYSRLMGMGLDASETIGLGCKTCQLRFKHGRETATPERLAGVFPPL